MAEVIHANQRRIAFHRQPTDGRRVVVFFHPAPGSGVFTLPTGGDDIAVVGADRPGYGWSDPMPAGRWATVASAADDANAVLGALGATRATAIGWSAGGRVALALAARHPEAVEAVVVVATPAPHEEVPWVPAPQYESLMSMRGDPADAVHARLAGQLQAMTPPIRVATRRWPYSPAARPTTTPSATMTCGRGSATCSKSPSVRGLLDSLRTSPASCFSRGASSGAR